MELMQLKYFLAVAESQHITKTAEKLHIAQPALSQAIGRLEKELGVPLFLHKGRNIVLTPYGKYLQQQLIPLLDTLNRLPGELADMAQTDDHTIRVNMMAASTIATEAIIAYQRENPDIHFQILQQEDRDGGDINIFTRMFDHKHQTDNHSRIYSERIFLAVPQSAAYSGKTSIPLHQMADEKFISLAGSRQFRTICDRFCAQAGFSPQIIFESDNPTAVRNLISAHVGVGFWPEHSWGRMEAPDMRLLEVTDPICQRDIVVNCRENKANNSYIIHFFSFLDDWFADKFKNR